MNAPEPRLTIPAIGTLHAGGTVLGHCFIAAQPFALIVPPKALREHDPIAWHTNKKRVDGATSLIDGLANTRAMAAAGSPLAQWALDQRIDGHNDWYIGSRIEQLNIYSNLAAVGDAWKEGNAEAFEADDWYWTSTQDEFYGDYAWLQNFDNGSQYGHYKSGVYRAFLVRREPIL